MEALGPPRWAQLARCFGVMLSVVVFNPLSLVSTFRTAEISQAFRSTDVVILPGTRLRWNERQCRRE
eukprot:3995171-Prorocentrum_lima.AAC.1